MNLRTYERMTTNPTPFICPRCGAKRNTGLGMEAHEEQHQKDAEITALKKRDECVSRLVGCNIRRNNE